LRSIGSSDTRQASDADGKVPYLLFGPNRDEPSWLRSNSARYRLFQL
jgi:hypothetical protein